MPLFDFRCRRCGERFEALVKAGEAGAPCPRCGAGDVEKLLSTFALRTGGSGGSGSGSGCAGCTASSCAGCR